MSQTLTLNSFAGPGPGLWTLPPNLDEDDFFTASQDESEQETVCFADQLMDIDFPLDTPLLDISTRSSHITLPTPKQNPLPQDSPLPVNRKRSITISRSHSPDITVSDTISDTSTDSTDVSDSSSTISSESDQSWDSLGSSPRYNYTCFLRSPTPRTRYTSRDRHDSSRDQDPWRPAKESKKDSINPRERMNMLRMSCTCQSRNNGKSLHLWEFLLEMLADKRMKSVITWTGHAREFRVVNSREVAREWGNRKNKPHMNFDKMSRAMRYYYKKNILAHGNKQRLVYSFCQEAICPHYEEIIQLALKTRPPTQGSDRSRDEPAQILETSSRSWDRSREIVRSSSPAKTNSASSKLKNESEKILTEKLCPGRGYKFTVRRPGKQDQCYRSCCIGNSDTRTQRTEHSRIRRTSSQFRTVIKNPTISNQPKIKINSSKPNYNDCFKFS